MLTILKLNTYFKVITDKGDIILFDTWDFKQFENVKRLLTTLGKTYEVIDWSDNNDN